MPEEIQEVPLDIPEIPRDIESEMAPPEVESLIQREGAAAIRAESEVER